MIVAKAVGEGVRDDWIAETSGVPCVRQVSIILCCRQRHQKQDCVTASIYLEFICEGIIGSVTSMPMSMTNTISIM